MSDVIIKTEDLGKLYKLGEISTGTISHDLNRWWAKVRGKDDPFAKIGQTNDRTQKGESDYVWALKDINFEVRQGEVLGIIGRNGAGKSTLLKILSKVTAPTVGQIKIKGRIASLLEVGTGFHPELTGRENIFLNGAILGMKKTEIRSKFDEIVDFAGVERYIDTPVKRYSSGMYVRLAFAVAAFLEPEILIVDEVLAVGDAEFQKKCLGRMKDVSTQDGRTVLFVSHNMGMIVQLCNKALLMNRGTIETYGDTEKVVEQYINEQEARGNNVYENSGLAGVSKPNYFTKVHTSKVGGDYSSDFSFEENIVLNFEFRIHDFGENLLIGIGLLDKYQNRVTTFLQNVSFFPKKGNLYNGSLIIPSSIIAPNNYSFLCVIWIKNGNVYDRIEGVCPIKIHDSGTEFALYEGADYGSILLKVDWQ
jgi:lipopolysaccharide transport system ATP-binding protein